MPRPMVSLPAGCDQQERVEGNLKTISCSVRELMLFQATLCAHASHLGNTGCHCTGENREGKDLIHGHTAQRGKRDWNRGYPNLIPALSVAPCFFSLKHFRCSRQLLNMRDHILISGSHSPSICWVWALLLTPTVPSWCGLCKCELI